MKCLCCGREMGGEARSELFDILTPQQWTILSIVASGRGEYVQTDAIIARLYTGEDGGPLNAQENIRAQVSYLNTAAGRKIVEGRRTYGYRLAKGSSRVYGPADAEFALSPLQLRVLNVLREGPKTRDELIFAIYGGRREPRDPETAVHNAIYEINRRLGGHKVKKAYLLS